MNRIIVQIVNTSVNLSKHTRIIKLYGPNTSFKLFITFAEKLLQAWESSYNFKKHFKKTILKRKVINIKDYYLSYYCVITLNVYKFKIPYYSKNQLKIFSNVFKRK